MFTKQIDLDPMMNHGEGCKCPLHNVIDSISIPEQQDTGQQPHPQKPPQMRKTIKLTKKQQRFLSEQVFKPQWIRMQVEAKGEQMRYARHKLSQWQKSQINAIHTIEKRLLEIYQISLTHYVVMHATNKTDPKPNTTCQSPQGSGVTQQNEPELGTTHQEMPEPNVTQQRMPEPQATQQSMPDLQGAQQGIPESQAAQQTTGRRSYKKQPMYSYFGAGRTMPIKLGGLLNVRPASFLQNHIGFANVPNSPVLENMNRIYKMSARRTGDPGLNARKGDNCDSGSSGSSGGSGNRSDNRCVGVQGTAACAIDAQCSRAYAMDEQNTGPCAMNVEKAGAYAMDAQNTGSCPMNVQQNATEPSQWRRHIRYVVLNREQQENYNSYRARKNWRMSLGTEPYLMTKKNDESNSSFSSYNVQVQQQYQNGSSSQGAQAHAMSRTDSHDISNPYIPFVAKGRSKYLARSVPDYFPVDPHFKRPLLNPPYVYPENIKPRTPPPPYPTGMVYHQQYAQSAQQRFPQPTKQYQKPPQQLFPQPGQQYMQPSQQYMQLRQQHTQSAQWCLQPGQQYSQPSQQYPQIGRQYFQTGRPYAQPGQQCSQSAHQSPHSGQQYLQPSQQYPVPIQQNLESIQQDPKEAQKYASQPAPQQYEKSATPLLYYI